jgi:hypothetical protein
VRTLSAYLRSNENDRRIRAAQTVLWLACVGPMLVFTLMTAVIFIRDPQTVTNIDLFTVEAFVDFLWLASYAVAAQLIAKRRMPAAALGALLGCALFARTIALSFLHHRVVAFETGYAVLGIALIARSVGSFERA